MTNIDHDALEELLRHASPRRAPSKDDEAAVRQAVRAEWRDVTRKRQARQRVAHYAIAATVLLVVFAGFNILRTPAVDATRVATIQKSIGPVYLVGDQSELQETNDLSNVMSGQTIITGDAAGLALAWGRGGSIRVDENSHIEFTDGESMFLLSGRVYFDSSAASLTASSEGAAAPQFALRTDLGEIQHLGTQYMTEVYESTLVVSVREGEVAIDGKYHDQEASSGQQVTVAGRQRPAVLSIGRSGDAWTWVSRLTPPVDVEGKSLHEFLGWACREMGLELRFEGDAEAEAHRAVLRGTIDIEPADAVRLRLASAALDWRIEQGVIYIYKEP